MVNTTKAQRIFLRNYKLFDSSAKKSENCVDICDCWEKTKRPTLNIQLLGRKRTDCESMCNAVKQNYVFGSTKIPLAANYSEQVAQSEFG